MATLVYGCDWFSRAWPNWFMYVILSFQRGPCDCLYHGEARAYVQVSCSFMVIYFKFFRRGGIDFY